jgi:inner membrane protein involved in colicin E2 resistance
MSKTIKFFLVLAGIAAVMNGLLMHDKQMVIIGQLNLVLSYLFDSEC